MRIFSLDERYKCLRTLDLNKYFARHQQENENDGENQEEPGLAVVGISYNCPSKNDNTPQNVSDYHATRYMKNFKFDQIPDSTKTITISPTIR